MPQVSKVGDGWGGTQDYLTLADWITGESAVNYGSPAVADCKGNCGTGGVTIDATWPIAPEIRTSGVTWDGSNTSLLAVLPRITATGPCSIHDVYILNNSQWYTTLSISSEGVQADRILVEHVSNNNTDNIVIGGDYSTSYLRNFVSINGRNGVIAGYARGCEVRNGLITGAQTLALDGRVTAGANFVVSDVFAFGNVTDFDSDTSAYTSFYATQDLTSPSGLTGFTSAELVDFTNKDYRVKSTSQLATAGTGGGVIGAFVEAGSGATLVQPALLVSGTTVPTPSISQDQFISAQLYAAGSSVSNVQVVINTYLLPSIKVVSTNVPVPFIAFDQFLSASRLVVGTSVFSAYISDGTVVIIPVDSRKTLQDIASYIRSLGYEGADNDVIMEFMRKETGITGGCFNEVVFAYLGKVGQKEGSIMDRHEGWRRG